jgi:ABC-type amino acid transport substrate-binding protein
MKRFFLIPILLIATAMWLMAEQRLDAQAQARKIASAIRVPLFGYDLGSVASIIKSMVNDADAIRAVEIIDSNSEEMIFEAHKNEDNTFLSGEPIPQSRKKELQQLIHPIVHEQEEIGELRLYYLPDGKDTLKLTAEEQAWIKAHPKQRVANEMDWPPFDFVENGEPKGYSIELINLIGEKTGLKLEFINGYTWSELLEKFKAGAIDIMPAIYMDAQRKSYMAFTESYFSQPSVIVVKEDRTDIEKLADLAGKKLAVIEGYSITQALAKSHPDIHRVPVKGVVEGIKAVSLGEVDAFIDSIGVISITIEKNFIPNIKIIGDTSLKEVGNPALHIGVSRANPILRSILNKGLNAVMAEEKRNLYNRWLGAARQLFAKQSEIDTPLSKEEKAWIKSHPVVRLGVDPGWPPFDFVDEKGQHQGLAADVLKLLGERLGFQLFLVPGLTWPQVLEAARERTLDLISICAETPERSEYLKFSRPFASMPWVIVTRNDFRPIQNLADMVNDRVAMVKGYAVIDLSRETYPDFTIHEVKSPLAGLKAVATGQMDAYVGNLGVASYLIQERNLANLKVAAGAGLEDQPLRIGIRSDWPELVTILNKGLDTLTREEMNAIRKKWIPVAMDLAEETSTIWNNS